MHAGIAGAAALVTLAGYGIWYAALTEKSAAVAALENAIENKTEIANRVTAARSALAAIADSEARVRAYFVSEEDIVAFIDSLQARGSALGTSVSVYSVATDEEGSLPALVFSLTIRGAFDNVLRTVGAIEYAPYALSISEFALDHDASSSWRADVRLRVASASTTAAMTTTRVAPTSSSYAYF
ncbi:MAG: hypothetical protein Q8P36_01590 [bacterium]|nr:hypothetical protein [bacterium]